MNDLIYFDNAATSFPKPPAVLNAMISAARYKAGNAGRGGHALARAADSEIHACRKALKEFFNASSPENVVFTQNATAALNVCVNGLIKDGAPVVTTDYEHNSVRRPLYRKGVKAIEAKTYFDDDDATVESFRKALEKGAEWLVICHASNVWGKALPVARVAALAHERGAKVILDASQSAGILGIDVVSDGIDYLCSAGHKGMYGPQGTGFIIVNSDVVPEPLTAGGTGSNSLSPEQPDYLPDALESGTLNVPAITGLRRGAEFLRSVGLQKLHSREISLLKRAYYGLSSIKNVVIRTSPPSEKDAPVMSFMISGKSVFEAASVYDEKGICLRAGYHCAPLAHKKLGTDGKGTLRISLGAFNHAAEIDYFLEITQKICN